MTNGVTVSGSLSFRSAIMGYVHMLGLHLAIVDLELLRP